MTRNIDSNLPRTAIGLLVQLPIFVIIGKAMHFGNLFLTYIKIPIQLMILCILSLVLITDGINH